MKTTQLPTYVVIVNRTPAGVDLRHYDVKSRSVGVFHPEDKNARYLDALELRDLYRSQGWYALVTDQRTTYLYEPTR